MTTRTTGAWQLITDATDKEKDGHDLLVAYATGGRQLVARYVEGQWVHADKTPIFPTHWQELGPPPDPATVIPPAPVLTSLDPTGAVLGSPNFTLRVLGSNFSPDAVIYWNGAPEPTNVLSATEVTTGVNMATAQVALDVPVVVQNGDGTQSNILTFSLTAVDEGEQASARRKPGRT